MNNQEINKYAVLLLVTVAVGGAYYYNHTKNLQEDGKTAGPGEYSDTGSYKNITPMKHDLFKQITLDFTPVLIIILLNLVLSTGNSEMTNIISFNNFESFRNSAVGRTSISLLGYGLFYQIIQPYLVNKLRRF